MNVDNLSQAQGPQRAQGVVTAQTPDNPPTFLRASGYDFSGRVYANINATRLGRGYNVNIRTSGDVNTSFYVTARESFRGQYRGHIFGSNGSGDITLDLRTGRARMDLRVRGRSGFTKHYNFSLYMR